MWRVRAWRRKFGEFFEPGDAGAVDAHEDDFAAGPLRHLATVSP